MRFSKVPIIATLMAAALLALVALPALAAPGSINQPGLGGSTDESLQVSVHALTATGDVDTTAANTKVGPNTYVSNLASDPAENDSTATPAVVAGSEMNPANRVTVVYTPVVGRTDGGADQTALPTDAAGARADNANLVRVRASSGDTLTLPWIGAGADGILGGTSTDDTVSLTFTVVRRGGAQPNPGELATLDGDTITLTIGTVEARLVVDGGRPVISGITPANGTLQGGSSVTVGFTVTDSGSGLRTDREDGSGTGDTGDLNDNDGNTAEPYSTQNGGAVDIDVNWNGAGNHERRGGLNWEEITRDKSYSTSYIVGGLESGSYEWYIEATDRVGNESRTDAKPSTTSPDAFKVTVDRAAPDASQQVYAGIGYDDEEEIQDSSSILLVFTNGRGGTEDALDGSTIDASDFTVEDNTVVDVIHPNNKAEVDKNEELTAGGTVTVAEGSVLVDEVIASANIVQTDDPTGTDVRVRTGGTDDAPVYADGTADVTLAVGNIVENLPEALAALADGDDECTSDVGLVTNNGDRTFTTPTQCVNTQNRVYLQLGTPLGDDEMPRVNLIGEVQDKAGNRNTVRNLGDAKDRVPPTLTVTIEGDVDVSGRPLAQEDITVTVSAGETLAYNPFVWLVEFDQDGNVDGRDGGAARPSGSGWTMSFSEEEITKVAAVLVYGEDVSGAGNVSATSGWKKPSMGGPNDGDGLDLVKLQKAGHIVEFDGKIAAAMPTIDPNPNDDGDPLETESSNPFITLSFAEGSENNIVIEDDEDTMDVDESATHSKFTKGDDSVKFDAYGGVWITAITLDGEDVSSGLAEIDCADKAYSACFSVALLGLSDGDHTLTYTAKDSAGNTVTDEEVDFEKLARSAYEVTLRPGWNLVSVPANPADTQVGAVLPSGHPSMTVLSYQNGEWVSASRDAETGEWAGTLTDIEAGYGYFIQTGGFDALETMIPEADPTSLLPVVQVVQGWNLLGVVDTAQRGAGTPTVLADEYFGSIEWRVAHSFDTQSSRWMSISQGGTTDADRVKTGSGYWVWVTKAGTLVPPF